MRSFLCRPEEKRSHEETSAAWRKLACIHTARHEHREAHGVYEELLREAEKADDQLDRLEAWIQLGQCSVLLKDYERAVLENQQALAVLKIQRQSEGSEVHGAAECAVLLNLGQAYRHLGRREEAQASYEQARTLAEAIGGEDARWRAEGNLGLLFCDLGRFDQAIRALEKTTEHYRMSRDRLLEAHSLFNQAYVYYRKGENEKARKLGRDSLRLLEQIGHPSAEEVRRQMATWQRHDGVDR